jgi:hypothetical protein
MATYLAFHEVDDVEHWLKSAKREEFSDRTALRPGPSATRTDPTGSA